MQPEPPTPSDGTTALRPRAYVTEGLPRHDAVLYCPSCWAYLQPPGSWIRREPRSWISATPGMAGEVASIHLGRVRRHIAGLGLTIAAARFVSTDPCPRRFDLRIHLRHEHEALKTDPQPQAQVVELTAHDRLCDACVRVQADPDQWPAVVQVRQRAWPSSCCRSRTLNHVKSLLVLYCGKDSFLRVDWDADAGVLDVHVVSRAHADRFVRFVSAVAPARAAGTARRQLVSRDDEGSPYDLVLLPAEASRALGGLGPLVLCIKVTNSLALLDTGNMRVVVVARASDVGKKDAAVFTVKTHLGYDLEPGCHALGYDLCGGNAYSHGLEKYGQSHKLPAAVLTTRYYDVEVEDEDWEESAGEIQDGREGGCGGEIEEVATAIGCMDLNLVDDEDATMAPFDRL
ncbi:unnamed protein product [Miscanthus lutarioriparius]|uniref:60S ribosomal export protein NMD3 n=1 Tax=Miscanthus lutarioriparius TaxID=422564 RepID=A0A811NHM4_9POAL|nr:unnamed protein product [Miscanthus lutarioriparius]